jgi:para-nitrobenzyl esterase
MAWPGQAGAPAGAKPEATSLLGRPLYAIELAPDAKKTAEANLQAAREALAKAPGNADAILWLGRCAAVAGHVREAIDVFTTGIAKFPADARFYRHRGHRYVTVREFDKAIADLSKASQLIAGKPDEKEPSTADRSVMSSESLHYAIYYHLGLAHYLKGNFARALPVYRQCLAVARGATGNDDQTAGASHWLYMTLRRLGRTDEAARVLEPIVPGMKVKDDQQYYDLLFMYKGLKTPDDLLRAGGDPVSAATLAYGVANWYLYNGRKDEAKALFERIVTGPNWMPFGFIAAEAELARMKALPAFGADRVKTANGIVESTVPPKDGVRSFKGLPFAAPPVGDLRWREPQPVKNWTGVRSADTFGPSCMQRLSPGADYWLRGDGMSEDCLYLNVWTPARSRNEKLPVLVYIFGGGFQNGDGSEPRYDGESMARQGIVAVSVNYRTNIFGFFVHPELTRESPHHASGNYGLLDQVAALRWVQKNIAAFGGDPKRVTIAGESAGSISVSALMASPLSRNVIAGAICESGAAIASLPPQPLAEAEKNGVKYATAAGADSLDALRRMTSQQLYDATAKAQGVRFSTAMDGYFLAKTLTEIALAGQQAKVPLLAGSNTEEQGTRSVLAGGEATPETLAAAIRKFYGEKADPVLKAYTATTTDEVFEAATHLASARFISYGTWKWTELHMKTGGKPVYRYLYARVRPAYLGMPGQPPPTAPAAGRSGEPIGRGADQPGRGADAAAGRGAQQPQAPRGAVHSAEIQYAMGNLDLDTRYAWEPADYEVSKTMQAYFVNFIKTGNPNGPGLPNWPAYRPDTNYQRMRIDVKSQAEPEAHRDRYLALDGAIRQ